MFCSKCGQELNASAVFCDKCGCKVGENNLESKSAVKTPEGFSSIPEKERMLKIRAITAYLVENAVIFGMIISLISSKFSVAASFIDLSYSSYEKVKEALQIIYEKTLAPWSWAVILLMVGNLVLVLAKFYIIPFMKRSYRRMMGNLHKYTHWGSMIFALYIGLVFAAVAQDSDFEIGIGFYIMCAVVISLRFVTMILYRNAAFSEPDFEQIEFDEKLKSDGKWQCEKCGSYNPLTIQSCRDCGKYR